MDKVLYLVRHCQATGQEPEAELSPEGTVQTEALAHFPSGSKIERIVSSPYVRALQSIEPFARSVGLNIETDERLIERVLGETSSFHWQICLRETFTNVDLCFPGGESSRTAQERAVSALQDILGSEHRITVLVSHGNLSTLLLNHFDKTIGCSTWEQMTNPDVFRVCLSASGTTVEHIWQTHPDLRD